MNTTSDIKTDLASRICEQRDRLASFILDDHTDDAKALLADLASSTLADATAKDLQALRVEIRRRQAAQGLLDVTTLDALRAAAQAGFARWWDRDGTVVRFLWFRACGWHPCGMPSWTDGQRVLLDAHLTRELHEKATAPVLAPLAAYFAQIVAPLPDLPDHPVSAERLHWLADAVTQARQQLVSLPEVDGDTEALIHAAGAGTALFSPDKEYQAAYLVGRGWHRLGHEFNFALPNGTGGNFGAVSLRKQADEDFARFVRTWPTELDRAAKPIQPKQPAALQQEPALAGV